MARPRKYAISDQELFEVALRHHGSCRRAGDELGIPRSTVQERLARSGLLVELRRRLGQDYSKAQKHAPTVRAAAKEKLEVHERGPVTEIEYLGEQIQTPEELIRRSKIDLDVFEIERVITNYWEQAGSSDGGLYKTGLRQIKVLLRRKRDEKLALERLLAELAARGPLRSKVKYPRGKPAKVRRALEVSLMDPHLGMLCYQGESDHSWNPEQCAQLCLWSVDQLIERAQPHGDFEEIVFPFGNDFLHHDNLMHTTTKGTLQPEGLSYLHMYEKAIELAVTLVDRLAQLAPVRVIQVSGNHDQVSAFSLGHVLKAYYRRDVNVTVHVDPSPYKFWRYGVNLVGFDHGHHVKPIRLAALMAHEARDHWAGTCFREWHLGDQHRKGSGSPVVMEEQGVSIEYLPSLTPPNAWHRLKAFNWQQRGAMAFVWDHDQGPLARLQVHLNSYTGRPIGR